MMYLIDINGNEQEVRNMQEASIVFKNMCREVKGQLTENAGELRGGTNKFFIGKVDRDGNIYTGDSWPHTRCIYNHRQNTQKKK